MANLEILALDPATPQIRAPGAGDGYSVPRDMTFAAGTTLYGQAINIAALSINGVVFTDGSKNLTSSGTVPVSQGGTGATTLTGYVKGNGTSAFTASATVPGSDVSGNISGNAANVTGTVAIANGGTGLTSTPTNGQLDIGNGTGFTRATLTAGSGISITNGAGSISIAATGGGGTVTSVGGTGTVNGITLTGTVTTSGNLTLGGTLSGVSLTTQVSGTLPIANGGTGQITAQAAINSLAGATTSGQYLRGNGTNVVMSAIQAADVPTLNQNTTGTASNVTGVVALANGGSGQTTAQAAMNAFAGAVTSGSYLRGNGTNVVMATIQAADVPTLNQNTTGTASNVTGIVAVANGGSGQSTAQAAMNTFAGATTSGFYLRGNGTNVLMAALAAGDLSGTVAVANGGTGQTSYTNGQLLIGNTTGNTLTKATLTAGSGITVTNGAGSITIASTVTGGAQDYIVQSYGIA